jgi:hypothetical protein
MQRLKSAIKLLTIAIMCLLALNLITWHQLHELQADLSQQDHQLTLTQIQMFELTDPSVIQDRIIDKAMGLPYGPDNYVKSPPVAPED